MNSFAWMRQDLSAKTRDFALDDCPMGMPIASPRKRKQRAKRFLGMAFVDLVPVAASLVVVAGQTTNNGVSGEALSQGDAVYADATTGAWWKADADASGKDLCTGIAVTTCTAASQRVVVLADAQNGQINLGCAVAAGAVYIASANAGKIVLYIDGTTPTTSWKTCIVGIGISTTVMKLCFVAGGVAHL